MKKVFIILLTFVFIFSCFEDAEAQRTRKRKTRKSKEDTESVSIGERLNYEIKVGNVGYNNGFGISLKGDILYKFNSIVSAGPGAKMFYDYINNRFGPDESIFTYGALGAVRLKVVETFYLQGEYHITKYGDEPEYFVPRFAAKTISYPTVGAGYLSGFGDWKFGVEGQFVLNEDAANRQGIFEYWFAFSYNF